MDYLIFEYILSYNDVLLLKLPWAVLIYLNWFCLYCAMHCALAKLALFSDRGHLKQH